MSESIALQWLLFKVGILLVLLYVLLFYLIRRAKQELRGDDKDGR